MKLIKLLLKRKIIVGLLFIFVVIVGSFATTMLDKELMPPASLNESFIDITTREMNAVEVERLITNPIEQRVAGIDGVEKVTSTTNVGKASIEVAFEGGRADDVHSEVVSAVNSLRPQLPDVENITMFEVSTSSQFEFYMDLSGGSMEEMTLFAKEVLKPRLEELKEVREVSFMGLEEKEVLIELKRDKLLEYELDPSQILAMIQSENTESSLGELKDEENQPTLRWNTSFTTVEDLNNIRIPTTKGIETLDTFAEITLQPSENTTACQNRC